MFSSPTADLLVVIVILVLFFGPKRLPGAARGLGDGIREFKAGLSGGSKREPRPEDRSDDSGSAG